MMNHETNKQPQHHRLHPPSSRRLADTSPPTGIHHVLSLVDGDSSRSITKSSSTISAPTRTSSSRTSEELYATPPPHHQHSRPMRLRSPRSSSSSSYRSQPQPETPNSVMSSTSRSMDLGLTLPSSPSPTSSTVTSRTKNHRQQQQQQHQRQHTRRESRDASVHRHEGVKPSDTTPRGNQVKPEVDCLEESLKTLHSSMQQVEMTFENARQQANNLCEDRGAGAGDDSSDILGAACQEGGMPQPGQESHEEREKLPQRPPLPRIQPVDNPPLLPIPPMDGEAGLAEGLNNTQWWMSLFAKLEAKHAEEKEAWQQSLKSAEKRKFAYKDELKDNLSARIQWLEDMLRAQQQQSSCLSNTMAAVDVTQPWDATNLAQLSRSTTVSTQASSSADESEIGDSIPGAEGGVTTSIEVTLDTVESLQRVADLERILASTVKVHESERNKLKTVLSKTVQKHELERREWVEMLEEAATVTSKGQQLSLQQQKQLLALQKEVTLAAKEQRKQWKEKVRVLEDLLNLTDQKHTVEKADWEKEKEVLESTLAQLTADKMAFKIEAETAQKQAEKMQEMYKEALESRVPSEDVNVGDDDARSLRDEPSASPPKSPGRLVMLEEQLDTAWAERDIYKQEAAKAKDAMESETNQLREKLAAKEKEVEWLTELNKKVRDELAMKETEWKNQAAVQIKQLRQELANIDNLRKAADGVATDKIRNLQEKRTELLNRIKLMEEQRDEERATWKLKLEGALAESRQLKEERRAMEAQIADSSQREAELIQKSAETKSEVEELKTQLAHEKKDRNSLVEEISAFKSQLENQKESYHEELRRLKYQMREKETLEQHLRGTHESLSKETDDLLSAKVSLESKLEILKQTHAHELQTLKEEAHRTKAFLELKLETIKRAHAREVEDLNEEVQRIKRSAEHGLLNLVEDHGAEVKELKDKLAAAEEENRQRLSELMNEHSKEVLELEKEHQEEKNKLLMELKTGHGIEVETIKAQLENARKENIDLATHTTSLANRLEELQKFHSESKRKLESQQETLYSEKEKLAQELNKLRRDRSFKKSKEDDNVAAFGKHHESLFVAINGLRKDFADMAQRFPPTNSLVGNASPTSELRTLIEQFHQDLNQSITALRAEREGTVPGINEIVDASSYGHVKEVLEQNNQTLSEIKQVSAKLEQAIEGWKASSHDDLLRKELASEVQRKEARITELSNQIEMLRRELSEEVGMRKEAELTVTSLSSKAGEYNEELMRLQAVNSKLEDSLKDSEEEKNGSCQKLDGDMQLEAPYDESSSPMLEEALALAQGLTEIVNGRGSNESENSVLEMLESLCAMMDNHDLIKEQQHQDDRDYDAPIERYGSLVPQPTSTSIEVIQGGEGDEEMQTAIETSLDEPPDPISTPAKHPGNWECSRLQLVVEQLYGKCQMLERERTEMMEVTIDLLESAREANSAELEAALATARRKASDEVMRIHQDNFLAQERMFRKLCVGCIKTLTNDHRPR